MAAPTKAAHVKKSPCQPGAVHTWHLADVQTALMNVRFEGNNGHDADVTRCLLMTQSGHSKICPAPRRVRAGAAFFPRSCLAAPEQFCQGLKRV